MIKNSILGKLCPVFHLRSAAVASRQNLNHRLVWPGTLPWCDREEEHTLVGGLDTEQQSRAVGEEWGGGSVVENYTTTINHFYTTIFLSSRFFPRPAVSTISPSFSLSFMDVHLALLICNPSGVRWSPLPPHSPSISTSFPPRVVYMLSLLICFFFCCCCCLPGIYPLSTGQYQQTLRLTCFAKETQT